MRWIAVVLGFVLVVVANTAVAQPDDFSVWLQGMRQDAMAQGITAATLDKAFAGVEPIPRVIELDHQQPELTLSFDDYIARVVTEARREGAKQHYLDNQALLDEIGTRYAVPPRYIVALWGIETNFGTRIGTYPVVAALATLAYDGRRAAFFRKELINALLIVQNDHVDPSVMIGSWAGAMGQSQFMPSSFLKFAVSYSGSGAPDIWNKPDDVFASIANYLAGSGWQANLPLGWPVTVPANFDSSLVGLPQKRPLADWAALGVVRSDGTPLVNAPSDSGMRAALLQPGGSDGPSFLVTDNFNVILRWNNSSYFALAVGYLADSVN
ncbi:MAG TPA: lytic murein transglycosylase [Stellaceae bacterium]|jgi:membrane-bound lytic murein transglycosylase B|nr:lytic murein transglycosylase [Stellaceae bacterium]